MGRDGWTGAANVSGTGGLPTGSPDSKSAGKPPSRKVKKFIWRTSRRLYRLLMIIPQEPTQSLAALNRPRAMNPRPPREQQNVALPLMIPLCWKCSTYSLSARRKERSPKSITLDILVFMIFEAEVSYASRSAIKPTAETLESMLFLDEPHVAVVKTVLLQYQPELRIIEMHGGRIWGWSFGE